MSLGANLLMLSVMIFAVIAVIAGPPVFLLVAGVRKRRRNPSFAATVMIGGVSRSACFTSP
jgi:hypothetical protein